jgi:hypothetical protein
MKTIYGQFPEEQFEKYKKIMHKELFWLLLYKDPKTKDQYAYVDYDKYFVGLMKKLDGLNELLSYPVEFVSLMSLLQAAFKETKKEVFDYSFYRKLVLDAHALIDKLGD